MLKAQPTLESAWSRLAGLHTNLNDLSACWKGENATYSQKQP